MARSPYRIALVIVSISLAAFSIVSSYGPQTSTKSPDQLKAEIYGSLDLGNLDVEQTALTIAKDYPGEYNLNQVSEVYDALRKGWYYYSDPSYRDKFKSANRTLQDGKISNSIGMGDCDDFAILMASLLESLQGSTRIVFASDQDTRLNHAYAEVYLGKKSDPRVDDLISWLKNEYNQIEIPGINHTGNEVWLNMDYNSTYPGGRNYPGGRYFGGKRTIREVVWQSASRNSPKIVPIINTMDNTTGWERIADEKGSAVSISSVPSPKGKAIQIDFDLKDGGWAGISRDVSGSMLSQARGLNLSHFGLDKKIALELILIYDGNTSFGYSWEPEQSNKWAGLEALFEDFTLQGSDSSSGSASQRLDPRKIEKLEIICLSQEKIPPGPGRIVVDNLRGIMNMPQGSPWERAEKQRKRFLATELASKAEQILIDPSKLIESVKLAIESLDQAETFNGQDILRKDLISISCLTSTMKHNDTVKQVVFSPDGTRIASASYDNTARIWDASSGRELKRMVHNGSVSSVVFSPDGARIATASQDNVVRIWDVFTETEPMMMVHNGSVSSVAFSPDGTRLASASVDETARIWDASTGEELAELVHYGSVSDLAFSPNGIRLATGSYDGYARIWDVQSGRLMHMLYHSGEVSSVSFSPDSTRLATTYGNKMKIWDINTGRELSEMENFGIGQTTIYKAIFSPDGTMIATAGWDGTGQIRDAITGKEITRVRHEDAIWDIAFSPDGSEIVTASMDKTARVWDISTGDELARMVHDGRVLSVASSPDGMMVATGSGDRTIKIWASSLSGSQFRMEQYNTVRYVAFSPDGNLVCTSSWSGPTWIWDISAGFKIAEVDNSWLGVIFSSDGKKIAGKNGNRAMVWDPLNGTKLVEIMHDNEVYSIALSPDGKKIATSSEDGLTRIWNSSTGEELARVLYYGRVDYLAFNYDGTKIVTGSYDNNIAMIWNTSNGKELAKMMHNGGVSSLAFSPDGTRIVTTSGDGAVQVWDGSDGHKLKGINLSSNNAVFSPNGTEIAFIHENVIIVWDAFLQKELANMSHDLHVNAMEFSKDGTMIASASRDRTARVWNSSTGEELARMRHDGVVWDVAFSPDGRTVITGSDDRVARIWYLRSKDLVCLACGYLECNSTTVDWRAQYCHDCQDVYISQKAAPATFTGVLKDVLSVV